MADLAAFLSRIDGSYSFWPGLLNGKRRTTALLGLVVPKHTTLVRKEKMVPVAVGWPGGMWRTHINVLGFTSKLSHV